MSLPAGGLIARSRANGASRISRVCTLALVACAWTSATSPAVAQAFFGNRDNGFTENNAPVIAQPNTGLVKEGTPDFTDDVFAMAAAPNFGAFDDGFTAFTDNGALLANPDIAVGPDHVVVVVSGEIAWFNKSQQLQGKMALSGDTGLWPESENIVLAKIAWNPTAQRYYVVATEETSQGDELLCIGTSITSNPDDGWHVRTDSMSMLGNAIGKPSLGVLGDGISLSFTMHEASTGVWFMWVSRDVILDPEDRQFQFANITNLTKHYAINQSGSATTDRIYAVSADAAAINRIKIVSMAENGAYDFLANTTVPTRWHQPPPPIESMGAAHPIDNITDNFDTCYVAGNSCWAAHTVNFDDRAIVRWYEFDLNGWPNSGQSLELRQSGDIDLGPDAHAFFPDIAVDNEGNAAIVFSISSANQSLTLARAVRFADDDLGTFQPHYELLSSTDAVTSGAWGAYVGIEADPVTPGVFWSHAPYNTAEGWKTYISKITLADDVPPSDGPRLNRPDNGFIHNIIPVLQWDYTDLSSGFRIHVSTGSDFGDDVYSSGPIFGSSHQIPDGVLDCNTRYYWRVIAETPQGDMMSNPVSRWFEKRMFQDINLDGIVDSADLGMFLSMYNSTEPVADFNSDGIVDSADLGSLLGAFGDVCN